MTSFVDKVLLVDEALARSGIDHAFGGAIALAYAVLAPRATDDIDVNISVAAEQAADVFACLPPAIEWSGADVAEVATRGQVRLRFADERTPVDLFFPQHHFHDVVAASVVERPFAGRLIPMIIPTHLAVFKVLFDRPKDWVDIQSMLEAGSLDVAEVHRWIGRLLGDRDPSLQRFDSLVAGAGAGSDDMAALPVDWGHLRP